MRFLAVILAEFLLLLGAFPAWAAEEILEFDAAVEVRKDAALIVTERIVVRGEGVRIRRGIYRDFPLYFRHADGSRGRVGFEVLSVRRDGQPEGWHTKSIGKYIRIYIGKRDVFLRPGVYTYTLKYRTTRQIRYFPDHDELYWNVTGNFWEFPIRRAAVAVRLPGKIMPDRVALFTGPLGSKESHARIVKKEPGLLVAETTRPLAPREGFTIVLALPKGLVREPSAAEKQLRKLWETMAAPLWLALGWVAVLAYFLFAWWKVGRDPSPGAIYPRWEPPRGLGPAVTGWLDGEARLLGADVQRAFIAALVSLGVKGRLRIERRDGKTHIRKLDASLEGLTPAEQVVLQNLPGGKFELSDIDGARLREILDDLQKALEAEVEENFIVRNRRWFLVGLVLVALVAVGLVALAFFGNSLAIGIITASMFLLVPSFILFVILSNFLRAQSWKQRLELALPLFLVLGMVVLFAKAAISIDQGEMSPEGLTGGWRKAGLLLALALPATLLAFWHLLPRPTMAGRRAMDEIEGLRMFIETAEQGLLNGRGGPKMSVSMFEKLLPYAIALGLEKPWTRAFKTWLASATAEGANGGLHWYRSDMDGDLVETLGEELVSGISADMAAAIPSVSDSGFSSSGGFSGGGGGGGGGGGW